MRPASLSLFYALQEIDLRLGAQSSTLRDELQAEEADLARWEVRLGRVEEELRRRREDASRSEAARSKLESKVELALRASNSLRGRLNSLLRREGRGRQHVEMSRAYAIQRDAYSTAQAAASLEAKSLARSRSAMSQLELAIVEPRQAVRDSRQRVRELRAALGERLELERERDSLIEQLGYLKAIYETASQNSSGDIIATIIDDICQKCHHKLPATLVAELLLDDGLHVCPRCRRVLHAEAGAVESVSSTCTDRPATARRAKQLTWEVLPLGWWRDRAFCDKLKTDASERGIRLDLERLFGLAGLSPKATYEGSHMGKRQYLVFEFEKVALAECWLVGNALYYTERAHWQDVFKLTKRAALRAGARRLVHRGDWLARAEALVLRGEAPAEEGTVEGEYREV